MAAIHSASANYVHSKIINTVIAHFKHSVNAPVLPMVTLIDCFAFWSFPILLSLCTREYNIPISLCRVVIVGYYTVMFGYGVH